MWSSGLVHRKRNKRRKRNKSALLQHNPLFPQLGEMKELRSSGLCQVKAESGTLDGWNHFIEGIAFHLKSSATLFGSTIGSP
jgi:hypothetical protein